jgi:phospholipid/cholesterol/gamma-HCH transport system substrate-binding protein
MSVSRAQKMRLGIFVIAGLVVLVGGLVVLAGMKLGEKRESYTIRYSDGGVSLSGLEVGSPVKYSGIRVGRVDVIKIDPKDVGVIVVEISLNEGTPVAEDTVANLGSMGITGLKYIELSRGSADAKIRKPGTEIPAGKSALDDLSNQAGEIAEKVNTAIERLNAFVAPEMKDRVASVLDRTDKLLATLEGTLSENREQLKVISTNLAAASAKFESLADHLDGTVAGVDRVVADVGPRLTKTVDETNALVKRLRSTADNADKLMAESAVAMGPEGIQKTLDQVDILLERTNLMLLQSRESIIEGLAYMRRTSENMTEFSRRIRDDPSLLLISDEEGVE